MRSTSSSLAAILAIAALLTGCAAPARTTLLGGATLSDREAVLNVVQTTLDALGANDIEAQRALMLDEGTLSAAMSRDGEQRLFTQSFEDHLQFSPRSSVWLERFWEPTVLIDGDLAMVWARYDFHVDGRLSHGGTNAMTLLRTSDGWRLASIVWTQEQDCAPSPLGPPSP